VKISLSIVQHDVLLDEKMMQMQQRGADDVAVDVDVAVVVDAAAASMYDSLSKRTKRTKRTMMLE
jgi:biotin synthase-related radical SAM superfamily protein